MNVAFFLRGIRERGIEVTANGAQLRLRAPDGLLDDSLRQDLARYKDDILELLKGPRLCDRGLPLDCCACGSPNWWKSAARQGWHCSYCEPRPEPFAQGRAVIVNSGHWGKH